ncbi:MAG: uroporphyrinogen-III synthase [Bryobacteraceae bacterium]
MPFDGLRVLSLESRRAAEMEKLIRNQGGVPFVAPSVREVPLADNPQAMAFFEKLLAGGFDMVVLLTGVGTRYLDKVLDTRFPKGSLAEGLKTVTVVCRGPKPAGVLREWNVPIAVIAPEPNTWREVLAATEGRPETRIAIQEYGRESVALADALRARGADVTSVPVYQWELPENLEPLREAARKLATGEFDVILLTAAIQVQHLLQIAAEQRIEEDVRRALSRVIVASIGPTTSETLRDSGLPVDFEPSHPKMGFLVNEIAQRARELLQSKQ